MQIYIQIPFSIFQPGFAAERTKKGRRRYRQRPIQSLCLIVNTMVGLNPTKH